MNERRQDFELLQRFTRDGEQSAFADVVRRHLDLVFATALRKVEDPGAAQEVAQNVFAALARKASKAQSLVHNSCVFCGGFSHYVVDDAIYL